MIRPFYVPYLNEILHDLRVRGFQDEEGILLNFSGVSTGSNGSSLYLTWKQKPFSLKFFAGDLLNIPGIAIEGEKLRIRKQIRHPDFLTLCRYLDGLTDRVIRENLLSEHLWGRMSAVTPKGFQGRQSAYSESLLRELYADDFVVKEKKPFVIDLKRSTGSYLLSEKPEQSVIIDAAAQIASLAVGMNDHSKNAMGFRPEIFRPTAQLENWDIKEAFEYLLKKESGLPYAYFVNSGAEAVETAIRACHTRYPDRKKIIAFEGSFHGRSVLALHATFNPAKRTPFEIFPGKVDFISFPENKTPSQPLEEPSDWLKAWASLDLDTISQIKPTDPVMKLEIESLKAIVTSSKKEKPLCVLVEPMLCEGGDRYGSSRFFRALRVVTRALDVPLIFDEIQTGFGLGGAFFWHKLFNLVQVSGEPDTPDCVTLAKKAQVGVCLSRFQQDLPVETSAASMYRGYLQAIEVLKFDHRSLETKVNERLSLLREAVGTEIIQFPRVQGLAFAFDLPDPKILSELVSKRFANGTLFYPAGEKTARFRLMVSTTDAELDQIFASLYGCFSDLKKSGSLDDVKRVEAWETLLQAQTEDWILPWKTGWIPRSKEDFFTIPADDWIEIFKTIINHVPGVFFDPLTLRVPLSRIQEMTREDLWKRYQEDPQFTLLDLLWFSSRAFGYRVRRLNYEQAQEIIPQVQELEKEAYEPARQDDPVMLANQAKNSKAIYLACFAPGTNQLSAICVAAPLKDFSHLPLVKEDPMIQEPESLYSVDLTISPSHQGKRLGTRLKLEQLIFARQQGAVVMRSRNRKPEAQAMMQLNRSVSAVVIKENPNDYGGEGTAAYQSVEIFGGETVPFRFWPLVRNKISLGNFVSTSYIHHLLIIKEFLPRELQHCYLASGRAECVDKMIKLLRSKRPQAKVALSLEGDYFGCTTAAARSLGGKAGPSYFDWPILPPDLPNLKAYLNQTKGEEVLGFFLEPRSQLSGLARDPKEVEAIADLCREKGIPLIFDETGSYNYRFSSTSFFASHSVLPDAMIFYPGHQLGVVSVSQDYYLEKPLMMISTWDGDELSLALTAERFVHLYKEL